MKAKLMMLLCAALLLLGVDSARSEDADPAVTQVKALTAALLKSMQEGPSLPMSERTRRLQPAIEQAFALPLITRLSVGPEWTSLSSDQQQSLIAAFTRFTVANYAHNFRNFDGQKFEIDDNVVRRGEDKIVRTRIIPLRDSPTNMLYRMREVDGTWKIIDVYSDGISALTLRRSDFAAAIASGGAPLLISHLNTSSDTLMR
jgi:phospholipid transport system substrate-binding protein